MIGHCVDGGALHNSRSGSARIELYSYATHNAKKFCARHDVAHSKIGDTPQK